jgi:hypothetical protein
MEDAMKQSNYGKLRKQYPEYVSLDQLHKICKIAKRSAQYLVENGIIPSVDTGRKTWRYKIALEDVIDYLKRRKKYGSMIPYGAASSEKTYETRKMSSRKCFNQMVVSDCKSDIIEYFNYIYTECDDLLTVVDVVEMIGFGKSTVLKLLKTGAIKSVMTYPKYIIPKQYLLEFVATPRFVEYKVSSEHFMKILDGFEIWKNTKTSSCA